MKNLKIENALVVVTHNSESPTFLRQLFDQFKLFKNWCPWGHNETSEQKSSSMAKSSTWNSSTKT